MRQELSRGLLVIYLAFLYLLHTVIHKVSRAIAKQKGQFLSFPENLADTKRKFYDVAHFPDMIGVIIVPTS